MPTTERPTIASRSPSPAPSPSPIPAITSNDLGAIVIEATRTTIERKGKMFGDETLRQKRRAEIHNLIWSWWPDREVTPQFLTVLELADSVIDLASAREGEEAIVLTQIISHLAVLATTFITAPSGPTPVAAAPAPEPERPSPVIAPTRLGMSSSPSPAPEQGNSAA